MRAHPIIDVVLVSAGSGRRVGGDVPKQYRRIAGAAVIGHAVDALRRDPRIRRIRPVIGAGHEALFARAVAGRDVLAPVEGGRTRRESVLAGLRSLADDAPDIVLIHDAARPFVPVAVIGRLVDAVSDAAGAVPALPVADSMVRGDGSPVSRADLWRVQTPQAFRFDDVMAAHAGWDEAVEATDDASMVRAAGGTVVLVEGDASLEKITTEADLHAAQARVPWRTAVGTGFDVHRLEDGEELWLGGILVPHARGLSGHSDADVGLHALTDAILGAIGDGDIGSHFPPSDPRWRGARSGQFLAHAGTLVAERGGRIDHLDLTLICEAPKIGPHREAMRAEIARLLDLPVGRVSVKATTTERLGFAGRGEGIAAQAAATVRLPCPPEDDAWPGTS